MIHISIGNSKMGMIPSFSLPAVTTCREGVPCAKRCYARLFRKSVLNGYDENFELAHHLLRLENELWRSSVSMSAEITSPFLI